MKNSVLPRMWQRIFFAILLLVLLSQATPLILVYMEMPTLEEQRETEVNYFCEELAANLNGRQLDDAHLYMDLFNKAGPEIWLEQDNGTPLAGTPVPGFSAKERKMLEQVQSPRPGARIWRGIGTWNRQHGLPLDLLAVEVNFADAGPATLFIIYPNYRLPQISASFYKALGILVLVGALTSYAVSRHLSFPLRILRKEVMAIDEKNLDQPISTSGPREVMDVTRAVNQLTAELGRHTRNMTELVANVSHELRSPLTRLEGHADFIEEGFDRASHMVETMRSLVSKAGVESPSDMGDVDDLKAIQTGLRHLTLLKEELNHMDNLVGTTLLSSRLDLNASLPPFQPVDLTRLCQGILRKRRLFIGNRGIDLSCHINEGIVVPGDHILMYQMTSNLLDNAVKYVSDQGRIHICLERQTNGVRLMVENTHPPFSGQELARLFEPFFRAGRPTGNGAGLGLSLVKKIIDLHGGKVSAFNTGDGLRLEVCLGV